ncbi:MAG: Fe-S cluster assembly protein HesB [Acidimicrobiaceae bacterium]|nr:Fe-S cluster assembly protein HesB [Acidimicrobiaceae bacterium]MDE0515212.1 Fe-S cluster assembly protein HesB [Acidimicrobiaceae bacterium]MDE0656462.1 Fe-S cluster assembly protein HesB [Acidimicrobiaceae bacterium]
MKQVGTGTLAVTGDDAADRLLNTDPLALLLGMLLDQQIPLEWAFMGPHRLVERLGAELDAVDISERDPDEFSALVRAKPALHRFPSSMAKRMQALCRHVADHYDGDAGAVWNAAASGEDLFRRLRDLPGYGDEKARILTAVLAKRFGVRPDGWEAQAGAFADGEPRSVADIDSPEALQRVRAWKKEQKALGKRKDE